MAKITRKNLIILANKLESIVIKKADSYIEDYHDDALYKAIQNIEKVKRMSPLTKSRYKKGISKFKKSKEIWKYIETNGMKSLKNAIYLDVINVRDDKTIGKIGNIAFPVFELYIPLGDKLSNILRSLSDTDLKFITDKLITNTNKYPSILEQRDGYRIHVNLYKYDYGVYLDENEVNKIIEYNPLS